MDILDEVDKFIPTEVQEEAMKKVEKEQAVTLTNMTINDGVVEADVTIKVDIPVESVHLTNMTVNENDELVPAHWSGANELLDEANTQNDAIDEMMLPVTEMSDMLQEIENDIPEELLDENGKLLSPTKLAELVVGSEEVESEIDEVVTRTHNSYVGDAIDPAVGTAMENFARMSGSVPKYNPASKKKKKKTKQAKSSRRKNRKK